MGEGILVFGKRSGDTCLVPKNRQGKQGYKINVAKTAFLVVYIENLVVKSYIVLLEGT